MIAIKRLFQVSIIVALCMGLALTPHSVIAQGETGTIDGYVYGQNGIPLYRALLFLYHYEIPQNYGISHAIQTETDINGHYSFVNLIPGQYRISVQYTNAYACEFYDGIYQGDKATVINLGPEEILNNISFTLDPAGSLSGRVVDQQGNPLSGMLVFLRGYYDGVGYCYVPRTDSEGNFTVLKVPTGDYSVYVEDPLGNYYSQSYKNAGDLANATLIRVDAPYETTGVDFTMELKLVPESGPRIWAWLDAGLIEGYSWAVGSSVTLTINDPSNGPGVDYSDSQTVPQNPWNTDSTYVAFTIGGDFQLAQGQEVTFNDGTNIKTLLLTRPLVTDINSDTNTFYGVADPSSIVKVFLCWGGSCGGNTREGIADQNGNWSVNFGIPGDGLPAVDFPPGTGGMLMGMNADGSGTMVWWRIPTIIVSDDSVMADSWPLGKAVTLEIDDPSTTQNPDYTDIQTVTSSSNPLIFFPAEVFNIKPGFIVHLRAGSFLKSLVVSPLDLTYANFGSDTLSGIATPNSRIDIQVGDSSSSSIHHTYTNAFGFWSTNFALPGSEDDEQTTFDLVGGNWVRLTEWNNHYNQTIFSETLSDIDNDGLWDETDLCPDDPTNTCDSAGSAAAVIGTDGGTLITRNKKVALNLPYWALRENISFSITDHGSNYIVGSDLGALIVVDSYSIQPNGRTFYPSATLTFHWYDADNNGIIDGTTLQEANLVLVKDGIIATPACGVNPNCDMVNNSLTIQITSLSLFELAAPPDSDGDGLPDNVDACPYQNPNGYDADHNGCTDNATSLGQFISNLPTNLVPSNTKNSLLSKVDNAIKSLKQGKGQAAKGQLQAFVNEVQAQRGKKINQGTAEILIAYAGYVIAQIP